MAEVTQLVANSAKQFATDSSSLPSWFHGNPMHPAPLVRR